MRILIANRGEIARRIIRTAHRLGHQTVAVYADPDADAPHVREATCSYHLGPADLAGTYLSIDGLLAAADVAGAEAVHPGYGFLSESADFARRTEAVGLTWIGPRPDAIERMGSKIEARRLASIARVPVIPGFDTSQDPSDLRIAADELGYPVLLKAAAGGGGKGIRMVAVPTGFDSQLREARAESQRTFGDDAVIVERYIRRPRHVEVQVIGDKHGNVIELGTRECSVQRRYQKLLEEAPAPNLSEATRHGLRGSATELARSIGYDSAGTVEFVVDDETGDYFFLEMNTRLQVEHPTTEAITGLDIVELMINSAVGSELPLGQEDVAFSGHAFEARINAEDPAAAFAPQTGSITHLHVPDNVRWDAGVELGSAISPRYDPMIAKLITHGPDRADALDRLRTALDDLVIGGLPTTAGFHRWLVDQDAFIEGRVTTRFVDETPLPGRADPSSAAMVAAHAWTKAQGAKPGATVWSSVGQFRTTPYRPTRRIFLRDDFGSIHDIRVHEAGDGPQTMMVLDVERRTVAVNDLGHTHCFRVLTRSEAWAPAHEVGHGHAGAVAAPFPAVVADVMVKPGDDVAGGDVIVVIEAMKMLHSLTAAGPGVVAEVRVVEGDQIETNEILVTFHISETSAAAEPATADEAETGGGP